MLAGLPDDRCGGLETHEHRIGIVGLCPSILGKTQGHERCQESRSTRCATRELDHRMKRNCLEFIKAQSRSW